MNTEDPLLKAIFKEGAIWKFLKQHGGMALYTFAIQYFPNAHEEALQEIMQIYLPIVCTCVDKNKPLYEKFAIFAGSILPKILFISTHKVTYWTDEEKQEYYGLAPSVQYYFNVGPKVRRKVFYQSLKAGDVFVGQMITNDFTKEFQKVHVLAYADGRNYLIDDLGLFMKIATAQCSKLKEGDYICVTFQTVDFIERQMYCTTNVKDLPVPQRVGRKLGVIEEKELPLHYILFKERPYNSYWSYLPSLKNRNVYFYEKSLELYNLDPKKLYSFYRTDIQELEASLEHEVWKHKMEKKKLHEFWLNEGLKFHKNNQVAESMEAIQKALKIYPTDVKTLINRATLYANSNECDKAICDLFKCLDVEPENQQAIYYLKQIVITEAEKSEDSEHYESAIAFYMKLLRLPQFCNDEQLMGKYILCIMMSLEHHNNLYNKVYSELPKQNNQVPLEDNGLENVNELYDDVSEDDIKKLLQEEEARLESKFPLTDAGMSPEAYAKVLDDAEVPNRTHYAPVQEELHSADDILNYKIAQFIQSCSKGSSKKSHERHYRKHSRKKSHKTKHKASHHAQRSHSSSPSSRNSRQEDSRYSRRSRSSSRSISSRCRVTMPSLRSPSLSPLRSSRRKDSHHSTSSSMGSRSRDVRYSRHSPSPSRRRKELHRSRHSRSSSRSVSSRYKDLRRSRSLSPSRRRERLRHSRRSRSSSSSRYNLTRRVRRSPSSSPSRPSRRQRYRSPSVSLTPPLSSKHLKSPQYRRSKSSSESPRPKK